MCTFVSRYLQTTVMKTILALLSIAIASVCGQTEPWCRCGAFVTTTNTEMMVYGTEDLTISSCDNPNECMYLCTAELNKISDHGNLWHVTGEGITVGQHICTDLADHFIFIMTSHKVYGYYEVCGGAWQYTGVSSQTELCCLNGEHKHCIS